MIPILVGIGCFLLQLVWDATDNRALRWLTALACIGLYVGATIALCTDPWRLRLSIAVRLAGTLCAVPFLLLLAQSLLIEIPGPLRAGSERPRLLVTTGTYALVRHPGVLWYFFFHLLVGIATGSVLFLLAGPLWAGVNAAAAVVQDRVIFPRVFGAPYDAYRQAVPFLIPRRASLHRCLATLSLLRMGGTNR